MNYQFSHGLHDFGQGCFGWLQPDGSWGLSNSGLIVDGDHALLVDTLFDLQLTEEMLAAMRAAVPAAKRIETVVNTHAHGDHTNGNQLLRGAEIIASAATLEEMQQPHRAMMIDIRRNWQKHGERGRYLNQIMGRFSLDGIERVPPTKVFERELTIHVGSKTLHLVNVGPAHTKGDVIIYVPQDRVVYTGDILFIGTHPLTPNGSITNWIRACDLILGWDVEIIVPGHGPVTDKAGVRRLKEYLQYILNHARQRFDAGWPFAETARELIKLTAHHNWSDEERLFGTVNALYLEFGGPHAPYIEVLDLYAEYTSNKMRDQGLSTVCTHDHHAGDHR